MVVLNFYGKIEPICISEKLGLYIANLPNEEYNEWRDALAEELELAVKANKIYQEKLSKSKVILVSHSVAEIRKWCDKIIHLENGIVKVYDDVEEGIRAYQGK